MKYSITYIKGGTDNCYIVSDGSKAILFDTASKENLKQVEDECSKYDLKLIVLSHPHFDHAENADVLSKKFNIPVARKMTASSTTMIHSLCIHTGLWVLWC